MKDDSGSYAVSTDRGSSASQMTAAKVMDVIARGGTVWLSGRLHPSHKSIWNDGTVSTWDTTTVTKPRQARSARRTRTMGTSRSAARGSVLIAILVQQRDTKAWMERLDLAEKGLSERAQQWLTVGRCSAACKWTWLTQDLRCGPRGRADVVHA